VIDVANGEYNTDFDTLTSAAMNKYYADKYKDEVAKQREDDVKSEIKIFQIIFGALTNKFTIQITMRD
jgi:hypothetical protein